MRWPHTSPRLYLNNAIHQSVTLVMCEMCADRCTAKVQVFRNVTLCCWASGYWHSEWSDFLGNITNYSRRHVFSSTAVRTSDLANVTCITRYVISEGHMSKCNMTLNIAALSRKGALCYQETSSVAFSLHNLLTRDTSETALACS